MMLTHWNKSLWVDMLFYSDTLSWASQSFLFLLNAACLVMKQQIPIVFIVLGFTKQGLKLTIHHTLVEQANHYTTDAAWHH
jgi:hypothetical protein